MRVYRLRKMMAERMMVTLTDWKDERCLLRIWLLLYPFNFLPKEWLLPTFERRKHRHTAAQRCLRPRLPGSRVIIHPK